MFWKVVTPAPTEPICVKVEQPGPVQRSMRKPSSLPALSVQARSICVVLTVVAVSALGAAEASVLAVAIAV